MIYSIFDIETDGLLPNSSKVISGEAKEVTKIWCLNYRAFEWIDGEHKLIKTRTLTSYKAIKNFFKFTSIVVGHDIIRYDIPAVELVLGIKVKCHAICTLTISWGLYPIKGFKHGLGVWGERLGIEKPIVKQHEWEGLTEENEKELSRITLVMDNFNYGKSSQTTTDKERQLWFDLREMKWQHLKLMTHRVEEDTKINSLLFHQQLDYLYKLYAGNVNQILSYISYLAFKADCLAEQAKAGMVLDRDLCEGSILELETDMEIKTKALSEAMPNELGKVLYKKPVRMMKKDGRISASGLKWHEKLREHHLTFHENGWDIRVVIREPPNPASSQQKKKWLFDLGWKPITFKENDKGEEIPQIALPFGAGICPSVLELEKVEPAVKHLKGLSVASHRRSVFKGFLKQVNSEGIIYAGAQGFTSTLRMQHRAPIVNLPKVGKWYGEEIRGCLTAGEGFWMAGADICGVEDRTKMHWMFFFDPEHVRRMDIPGFDGHLYMANFIKHMTEEEVELYKTLDKKGGALTKEEKVEYKRLKGIRGTSKTANFQCVYKSGIPKIAKSLKISLKEAGELHRGFWKINNAVLEMEKNAKVKKVNGQDWVLNPVSGFWYLLRNKKDIFSAINQSTAVFVFDLWLKYSRIELNKLGLKVCLQVHDEKLIIIPNSIPEQIIRNILDEAMVKVNKTLQLNVEINIDTQVGQTYADCH